MVTVVTTVIIRVPTLEIDTISVCSGSSYCLHSRCIETDRHHHELSRIWKDLVQVSL